MASSKSERVESGSSGNASRLDMAGQLAAINRSQAVIELALDGTILCANSNFLQVLGYSREEVAGRDHGMLVQPEYRDSTDYVEFWAKLARGEFDAAFRHLRNGALPWRLRFAARESESPRRGSPALCYLRLNPFVVFARGVVTRSARRRVRRRRLLLRAKRTASRETRRGRWCLPVKRLRMTERPQLRIRW